MQQDQTEKRHSAKPVVPQSDLERLAGGLRILLADDSEDNRFLIVAFLKKTGSIIDLAEDGQAALGLFRANTYDVVLMDVEMPVMDGYMATSEIRRLEKETGASPTPVLALTAHAFADMTEKGLETGFTELLTKPIRKTDLLEALIRHRRRPSADSLLMEHLESGSSPLSNKIQVEEGMEAVVPGYLDKRRADVAAYRIALAEGNFEAIRAMAHKMKGTGTGYGFPVLTEIGSDLEKAARRNDSAAVRAKTQELAIYLSTVELEYIK